MEKNLSGPICCHLKKTLSYFPWAGYWFTQPGQRGSKSCVSLGGRLCQEARFFGLLWESQEATMLQSPPDSMLALQYSSLQHQLWKPQVCSYREATNQPTFTQWINTSENVTSWAITVIWRCNNRAHGTQNRADSLSDKTGQRITIPCSYPTKR